MGKCPNCENDLVYIEEYDRSYCHFCQQYQNRRPKQQTKSKQSKDQLRSEPQSPLLNSRYNTLIIISATIIVIILIILAIITLMHLSVLDHTNKQQEDNWEDWPIISSPQKTIKGNSIEYTDQTVSFNISEVYVISVSLELNWKDESNAAGLGTYQNQPDGFNFTVYTPWGEVIESESKLNEINGGGVIEETIIVPTDVVKDAALGKWNINIHCDNCGDQESTVSIVGSRDIEDTGNAWVLIYYYEYHSKE